MGRDSDVEILLARGNRVYPIIRIRESLGVVF